MGGVHYGGQRSGTCGQGGKRRGSRKASDHSCNKPASALVFMHEVSPLNQNIKPMCDARAAEPRVLRKRTTKDGGLHAKNSALQTLGSRGQHATRQRRAFLSPLMFPASNPEVGEAATQTEVQGLQFLTV